MVSYKGKSRNEFILSLFFRRLSRVRRILLLSSFVLIIVFVGHRYASYKMNTRVLVKAPINDIARECPKPNYPIATSKSPSKICITTLTDSQKADPLQRLIRWRNFDSLLQMTWPNKESYVKKHGYYLFDESTNLDTSRPPSWSKIRAAKRLLTEEKCDWVFWMDADTVIMNSEKRIQDFLPEAGKDLIITEQKGGSYNAGAWLLRNTPWSLEFLDHWWSMKEYVKPKGMSISGDNDALKAYLLGMDKAYFNAHIVVPPRCTFNSVTHFLTPSEAEAVQDITREWYYLHEEKYHKGDFVAHVAGKNNKIDTTAMLLEDAV